MAHDLYARLLQETDDEANFPNVPKPQFFAALREYARGKITAGNIAGAFLVDGSDAEGLALLSYINAGATIAEKIDRVNSLEDVLVIYEGGGQLPCNPKNLYPTKVSIKTRFSL